MTIEEPKISRGVYLKIVTDADHECVTPNSLSGVGMYGHDEFVGSVWRCVCGSLWVHRRPLAFFLDMVPVQRTVAEWCPARWWERLRWRSAKPVLTDDGYAD